jgi:hypothetical protein
VGRGGKALALGACFVAGIAAAGLLAVSGTAADALTETTTITETTTTSVTTTAPAETVTVATTETVEHTTTQRIPVPATTAATESSDSGTPAWVWALLAILAVALVVAIVLLATRGRQTGLSLEERGQRLDRAVGTWVAQGWGVESDTRDSAVLRRGTERMIVSVDPAGQVTTRPG